MAKIPFMQEDETTTCSDSTTWTVLVEPDGESKEGAGAQRLQQRDPDMATESTYLLNKGQKAIGKVTNENAHLVRLVYLLLLVSLSLVLIAFPFGEVGRHKQTLRQVVRSKNHQLWAVLNTTEEALVESERSNQLLLKQNTFLQDELQKSKEIFLDCQEARSDLTNKNHKILKNQSDIEKKLEVARASITDMKVAAETMDKENSALRDKIDAFLKEVKAKNVTMQTMSKEILFRQDQEESCQKDLSKLRSEHPQVVPKAQVWKSSASVEAGFTGLFTGRIDELNGPQMESGVHVWKIRTVGGHMDMGVLSTAADKFDRASLSHIEGGWAYGSLGDAWTSGKKIQQKFRPFDESVVTFFLDLDGIGTLSVAVDDKPPVFVFTDMKQYAQAFVPAIEIHDSKSRAIFLGFE